MPSSTVLDATSAVARRGLAYESSRASQNTRMFGLPGGDHVALRDRASTRQAGRILTWTMCQRIVRRNGKSHVSDDLSRSARTLVWGSFDEKIDDARLLDRRQSLVPPSLTKRNGRRNSAVSAPMRSRWNTSRGLCTCNVQQGETNMAQFFAQASARPHLRRAYGPVIRAFPDAFLGWKIRYESSRSTPRQGLMSTIATPPRTGRGAAIGWRWSRQRSRARRAVDLSPNSHGALHPASSLSRRSHAAYLLRPSRLFCSSTAVFGARHACGVSPPRGMTRPPIGPASCRAPERPHHILAIAGSHGPRRPNRGGNVTRHGFASACYYALRITRAFR